MGSGQRYCELLKVYVYRLPEDEPRKSTGMRLVRLGLAERLYEDFVPRGSVVLDPYATEVLHSSDYPRAVVVVDRSWRRLMEEKAIARPRGGMRRRLPLLKAANPINYARLGILSSAEAVAAALYVLGCRERALGVLRPFKWGQEFLRLNGELLELYVNARTREEILSVERNLVGRAYEKAREGCSGE